MILKPEQERVINHDTGNLLVSASAGSGKTFATIKRITRLIIQGKASVKQILAVTFTEKAALDMKEKLIKSLIKEINSGKTHLLGELEDAKTADITTLHSFCARLLRSYFFYADLPSDFDVIDEVEADKIMAETLDSLFEELYESKNHDFEMLVKRHSVKRYDRPLRELVVLLNEHSKNEADSVGFLHKAIDCIDRENFDGYLEKIRKEICARLNSLRFELEVALKTFIKINNVGFIDYINGFLTCIENHLTQNLYDIKNDFYAVRKPNKPKSEEGLIANALVEKVKAGYVSIIESLDSLTDYDEDLDAFLGTKNHASALVSLVLEFDRRYQEEKRKNGKVDFSDLEHLTLKLLENDEFASSIREKYKFIFVDEYQDTNGVQEEILARISDNNLFMVGDLKQSIYGFRGCNPMIFAKKLDEYPDENKALLNYNYRSASAVIKGVNKIFGEVMTKDFAGIDYANTCPLKEGGRYPENLGEFKLCRVVEPKITTEYSGVYDLLKGNNGVVNLPSGEGLLIVKLIEENSGKPYYDPDEEKIKTINYGDICILARSRNSHVEGIIDQLLRANIPVSADNVVQILQFPEIIALVNLVKTLDNMQNEIPLVSTLKNFFEFTDNELAKIRREKLKGSFSSALDNYLSVGDQLATKIKTAKEKLVFYRKLAKGVPAFDLLRKIIADTDFELKCLALPRGREKNQRIQRFLSETNYNGKLLSVREFLDRISNSESAFKMEASGGEDAVKVMTMHASKGLEFPMVIVANTYGGFNKKDLSTVVIKNRECCFSLLAYDDQMMTKKETAQRIYLKQQMSKSLLQEELRLYYVALTRAKYSLFITGGVKDKIPQKNMPTFANCYADFTSIDFEDYDYYSIWGINDGNRTNYQVCVGDEDKELQKLIEDYLAFNYPDIDATTLPIKTSVTASLSHEKEEYKVLVVGGETTAEKGTIAHKVLEFFDFTKRTDEKTVLQEIDRLVECDFLTKEELDKINISYLVKTLLSKHFDLDGYDVYREKNFFVSCPANMLVDTSSKEEILLQGVIDLLAVKGDRAIIIDYKYSSKDKESLKNTYAKQLALYKYAVEKALGVKVEKTVLVSLKNAEFIEL